MAFLNVVAGVTLSLTRLKGVPTSSSRSEAGAVHNDKRGRVEEFEESSQHYVVRISGDKQLRVKPENLRA